MSSRLISGLTSGLSPDERAATLLHHRAASLAPGDSLTPPLVMAAPFHLPGEPVAPFAYGRMSSPTWETLESALQVLEGAPVRCFPSGMAAITAILMATLSRGDRIVLPSDGYYVTRRILQRFLGPLGIDCSEHPTTDLDGATFEGAALVFLESPSNPGLDVCDLADIVERAHAVGARVVVDNTTMTPLLQRPLDFGADAVIAADTKAPGGHSDLLAGHVASHDEALLERVHEWRTLSGAIASPFDAWLLQRGLETLEVRLERMCNSAQVLAERLVEHRSVSSIRFPGLPDDPSHAVAQRQMDRAGFLIGLTLADANTAERFLSGCTLLAQSTSFGAVHTAGERRARWGDAVAPGFVRLSVGCEPTEALWSAIDAALVQAVR